MNTTTEKNQNQKMEEIQYNEEVFEIKDIFTRPAIKVVAARIHYPNCPHGDKIMVFKGETEESLRARKSINPHFGSKDSPVARFDPDQDGWVLAAWFVTHFRDIKIRRRESDKGEVARYGVFDMTVCVPKNWTDEQVEAFANSENPSGTSAGWSIRKQGDKFLAGADERVTCSENPDKTHITLDC